MKYISTVLSLLLFSSQLNAWTIIKDFEDGAVGTKAQTTDSFDGAAGGSKFSNWSPVSGSQSGEVNIEAGEGGFGQWGGSFGFPDLKDGDEIWFRVFFYFPTDFNFSATGIGLKTMRIHTASSDGGNEGYLDLLVGNKQNPPNLLVASEVAVGGVFSGNNPDWGDVGVPVPKGTWHSIEQYVKFAANPKAGIYRVWQNGELVFEDLQTYTLRSTSSKADFIYLFTNWNGGAPKTQKAYVDHVVITSDQPATTDALGNPFIGTEGLTLTVKPNPPIPEPVQ